MVSRWTNQLEIIPSVSEESTEVSDFTEGETKYFDSVDEFAEYFGDDFLVCSWLPENVKLEYILVNNLDGLFEIVWNYKNENTEEWKMQIWMYQNMKGDTAGVAGKLKFNVVEENYIGNIKITYYEEDEGLLIGFEYSDYWYLIDVSINDRQILENVMEGMIKYE